MVRRPSDPALKLIIQDEARALLAEFGAGAALFATGQIIDAKRSGQDAAAAFWTALLEAVTLKPATLPTGPGAKRAAAEAILDESVIEDADDSDFTAARTPVVRRMASLRLWLDKPVGTRFAFRH